MDGFLLVDKPTGISSFGVVARVRRVIYEAQKQEALATHEDKVQGAGEQRTEAYEQYSEGAAQPATQQLASSQNRVAGLAREQVLAVRRPKVGHTGTLDPAASGLMILVIGTYCKRAAEFSKLDKTYEVELTLGATSTTGDIEGEITQKSSRQPSEIELEEVLGRFVGQIMQTPPIFSAIKVDGQRAYKLARAGKEVKLQARPVTIHDIDNIKYKYPKLNFTTSVSSGTYIRSLVEDIGKELGTGAYMSALKRTKIDNYELAQAVGLDNLNAEIIQKDTQHLQK